MTRKTGRKNAKPLPRKQMKKTRGGGGAGRNELKLDDTPGAEPTPAAGHVKVFSTQTEMKL